MLPPEDPPDGGWGWLVVLAGFLANSLTFGILRSLGVLFEDLVGAFQATTAQVSWVTAIALATQQFASPLGTAASTRYGARPVVMLGGLLSSLGIFGASFSTSLFQLYLSLGFLTGLGWALAFAPTMGTLSRYFSTRRSLAMGLALTGNGLTSFALSPLLRLVADHLAWRGTLLATSALTLHLLPGGALLRPLALRGDPPKLTSIFDVGLLAQRGFGAFALGTALLAAGYFTPYVHLDAYGRALGIEPYSAAFVVSLAALADAVARLLTGCVADRRLLPPVYLLVAFNSLVGATLLFFPAASSYASLLLLAVLYGASAGSFATVAFAVLPELVGISRVVNATGLCMMSMSVGGLLGPPLSGFLRDQTGDFTASFLVGGAFVLCASLVFLALPSPSSGCRGAQQDEMPSIVGHPKTPCPMPPRRHLEI
ncbi:monocarboxylate transporter 11 [Pantherophis guttatus]|uniref:Monocarboxylate transporter 11 n=1 Tax=Pantherophis guttatus TaxID=94885 RepID=A0ABM3YYL7_PANGU|nr:monocarboxylate transporter 11 [Pantherophis guttatus]XP_060541219.1 monocarboxylate transporter 11 [Pantherophis guttatus]